VLACRLTIRNIGLVGAIELQPIQGSPTKRAFSAFLKAFEQGLLIHTTGDIIALSPPLSRNPTSTRSSTSSGGSSRRLSRMEYLR
jgi:adenosylmethionine-8-amino-7-oxononanoate aminotransferase